MTRHVELFVLFTFLVFGSLVAAVIMGCLDVSEYPRVVFPNLIEQHGAETFHQHDSKYLASLPIQYGPWHPRNNSWLLIPYRNNVLHT